jgi:hypothetical protein
VIDPIKKNTGWAAPAHSSTVEGGSPISLPEHSFYFHKRSYWAVEEVVMLGETEASTRPNSTLNIPPEAYKPVQRISTSR